MQIGPNPHRGNHLHALKYEMMTELFGKLSWCLLSSAFTSWLREYISNVKIWKSQLHEIQRLEKTTTDLVLRN